jgi:ADP-ribose pyrophosphatase YjhB (NUDIX family)
MNYCSNCGARVSVRVPPGDDRPRYVCESCHTVHYQNPKMVVGCIPEWEDKILLCRRSIEPCAGKWTLPAGYLENGESVAQGAKRESLEEARADIEILQPFALYNICHINQIYLMFRARLRDAKFGPGEESSEVGLFLEADIPWDELAFRVIHQTLVQYYRDRPSGRFPFHVADVLPVN